MQRSLTSVRVHKRSTREEGASLRERDSGSAGGADLEHVSVMVREAVDLLSLQDGNVVFDATAGSGGHSEEILKAANVTLMAIDADRDAVSRVEARLKSLKTKAAKDALVIEGNFRDADHLIRHAGFKQIDRALFDLGWNMKQLASGRGFSFMHDEPLNMSYGDRPASGFTAAEILNTWSEDTLADVFFGYGEERYAKRVARAVVERREDKPIETTLEFAEIIRDSVPAAYRHGKINPATRAFQALRIAVNDELGSIEKGISGVWKHLSPGGRIAVISFHSIEDRLIKHLFAEYVKKGEGKLLTKKPLQASPEELSNNRPSRSAKLRGIEKL